MGASLYICPRYDFRVSALAARNRMILNGFSLTTRANAPLKSVSPADYERRHITWNYR